MKIIQVTPRRFCSLQKYFELHEGMPTVIVVLAIDPVPVFLVFQGTGCGRSRN